MVYDVGHIQFSMQNVLTSAMIKKNCSPAAPNKSKWMLTQSNEWIAYTLPSKSVIFPLPGRFPEDPEARG